MRPAVFLFAAAAVALALPGAAAPLTPEQALNRRDIATARGGAGPIAVSPDGRRAAFVVMDPPTKTGRPENIWLFDEQTGQAVALTHGAQDNHAPQWSPDGQTLAFLSNRAGATQVYLLPMGGGEAHPLTKGDEAVRAFAWAPDGHRIALLAPEPRPQVTPPGGKDDDAHVVDRDDRPARLWTVDVTTGERRLVSPAGWEISELQWMPDGSRLVVSATDQPASDRDTNRIYSLTLADGKLAEIAAPRGPFGSISVSPDGSTLAYLAARVDGPEPSDIYVRPLAGGAARDLT